MVSSRPASTRRPSDPIRRLRQRRARDHPPEQALAFDRTFVDPDEMARECAPEGLGLLGGRLRVGKDQLQPGRDGTLHAAEGLVLSEA